MISLIASIVGPRFAKPVFYGVLVLLVLGAGFTLAKCSGGNRQAEQQAQQTTRSGEAYSNAVANGIDIIDNRTVTESSLAEATAAVKEEIGNAGSLDDIRTSLVTRLCQQPSHAKDPACVK